jgi:hypothetical protein
MLSNTLIVPKLFQGAAILLAVVAVAIAEIYAT